mmetsp:Transcript_39418/g.108592  ORF Transcript_39418/g.108592 Transcript_39418/m.108592 type:complete len:234 (+) Transcript_39418:1039-1740(+)
MSGHSSRAACMHSAGRETHERRSSASRLGHSAHREARLRQLAKESRLRVRERTDGATTCSEPRSSSSTREAHSMAGEWSASHSTMCSVQTVREAICGAVSAGSRERCKLTREAQWLVRIGSTSSVTPAQRERQSVCSRGAASTMRRSDGAAVPSRGESEMWMEVRRPKRAARAAGSSSGMALSCVRWRERREGCGEKRGCGGGGCCSRSCVRRAHSMVACCMLPIDSSWSSVS